jgi:hypothetical protein
MPNNICHMKGKIIQMPKNHAMNQYIGLHHMPYTSNKYIGKPSEDRWANSFFNDQRFIIKYIKNHIYN